jgi:hypothetical protein
VLEGSRADQLARLRDPASRKIKAAILVDSERAGRRRSRNVQFSGCGSSNHSLADARRPPRQRGLD